MSRMRMMVRWAGALAGLLVPGAAPRAQMVSATAVVTVPRSSVRFGNAVERSSGVLGGVELGLRWGRLDVWGSGTRGRLTPDLNPLPSTLGEVSLTARYDAFSWVGAETRYQVRAASSATGYRRWETWGLGVRLRREMGCPGIVGSAGLSYSPVAHVVGVADPTLALSGDVGISFAPATLPLVVGLAYRTERYRFPSAVGRSEEFEGLTVVLGWTFRPPR